MNWKVPYFDLELGEEEKQAVLEVLVRNWLTTGPQIAEFEAAFARCMGEGPTHAIAVSNCTAALHLAIVALGIRAGDEVICPSLTFVASANAIRYTGATPVFVDICSDHEWNLDPEDVESRITERTKAIMVVHYGGYPCRMNEILAIAQRHNLKVVEDACHGPLAEWKGIKLGTIGDIGCFSFYSNKNMTTGEGGMIITKNPVLAEKMKIMRSHGMTSTSYDRFKGHAFGYDVVAQGYNYRMDEMRAAMGLQQLKKLPRFNLQRQHRVRYYREALSRDLPNVLVPFSEWDGNYGYHIFPILLPERCKERAKVMAKLAEEGIQTSIHYRPIHTFTDFCGNSANLPRTDAIAPRILTLPLYPSLSDSQVDYVVSELKLCLASSI